MIPIAKALAHLHMNGIVHGHVHPVSRPTLIIPFRLAHSQLKAVIRIKDDGNVTLIHTGANTTAWRVLHLYIQSIPLQESFAYHAPEFVMMDAPRAPTKEIDVYAFGSTLYTVRHHPANILSVKLMKPYLKVMTGVVPFDGRYRRLETTIIEIGFYGHRRLPKPDSISEGLWDIIRGCWEYDPVSRPQMKSVVDALISLLHLQVSAQPCAAVSAERMI